MGCGGCSSGGCSSGLPRGCRNNGNCGSGGCNKLIVDCFLILNFQVEGDL